MIVIKEIGARDSGQGAGAYSRRGDGGNAYYGGDRAYANDNANVFSNLLTIIVFIFLTILILIVLIGKKKC